LAVFREKNFPLYHDGAASTPLRQNFFSQKSAKTMAFNYAESVSDIDFAPLPKFALANS